MMKIIGIATMMISSILFGLSFYKNYKVRPTSLEMYIKLISKYLFEMKWKRKTFADALKEFDKSKYINMFNSLLLCNSLEDSGIYKNDEFQHLFLNKKDKDIISSFLKQTGKGNVENEISLCNSTIELLKSQKEEADINYKKMGPLMLKLSIIIAVWLAIIFI